MNEQCKKIRNMILEEQNSGEVAAHINTCAECRTLAEAAVFFREIPLPEEKTVPAHLDSGIKLAARQKLQTQKNRTLRILFEVGSLAALFVFAMVVLYQQPQTGETPAPVRQTAVVADVETAAFENELDHIHAELADLSDDLDSCGTTDTGTLTDISNLSQLELDYALYQANL